MDFFVEKIRIEKELKDSPLSQTTFNSIFSIEETENETMKKLINQEGLNSGSKATNTTQNAPIGSPEIEGFLKELEQCLITQAAEEKISKRKCNEIISLTLSNLRKSNKAVIATGKTNSYRVVPIDIYKLWVNIHL